MVNILDELLPHHKKKADEVDRILIKAHEKAQKIVSKAIAKSNQILTQANYFHKSLKQTLKDELKAAVEKSAVSYKEELQTAISKSLKEYQEIIKYQLSEANKEIIDELNAYKESKKAEIDIIIADKVEEIVEKTFAEELPLSLKEKLLFKALEKAKKHGLFKDN